VTDFVVYVRDLTISLYGSKHVLFEVVSISCLQFRSKVVDSNLENVPFVESASSQHQHGDNRTYIYDVQEPLKQASKQRTSVTSAEAYSVFCTVNSSARRMVRCSICCKHPDVARCFQKRITSYRLSAMSLAQHQEKNGWKHI